MDRLSDLVGTVLGGRYTIESKIGGGAMGTVYRARHARIPRSFAVKVLHKHLVGNPKLMTRFHREAELAGRLEHGNLVAVVDVGESHGVNYLVMELAEGTALVDLLGTAFEAPRVIRLVRQLCDGLHYAHELGLIHRDFKPENVIITRDDQGREVPRIVDFGIAILREQAASQDDRLTTAGLVLGTPHYMAPEQAMGAAMDPRVDLFALGVICYELLTGKMPFDGSGVDVARANLLTPTPAMAARVKGLYVDPLLEAFTRMLLAKDKADRPPTARAARDLIDLIERDRRTAATQLGVVLPAIDGVPHASTPDAGQVHRAQPISRPPPITDKLPRSSRSGLAVAGIIAAAVFAIIMIAATRGSNSDTSTDKAEHATSSPTVPPDRAPDSAPTTPYDLMPSDRIPTPTDRGESPTHRTPTPSPDHVAPAAPSIHRTPTGRTSMSLPDRGSPDRPPPPTAAARSPTPATEPTPDSPVPPTPRAVAEIYVAVGGELKAYSDARGHDAIADLWSRYRRIILNDVMATPARRQAVTELLELIRRDLANR